MIYIVEDNSSIRELVIYTLNSQGLDAEGFELPSVFWSAVRDHVPSLVILDIMLPEEDGLQILKKLRAGETTKKVPVLMLTAKDTEYDKVMGLDLGADDYMAKPFGMMELIARIKALLRRTEQEVPTTEYQIDDLRISLTKHEVWIGDQMISLTLKEFELLCFLIKNKNHVQTRDHLLNEIWGYEFDGESRTVDVHIRTLRQKLGEKGSLIETVRGVGYKIGGGNT